MPRVELPGSASRGQAAPQRKSFLVEALILLTILMTAIAVFVSLFSSAEILGDSSVELDRAVMLASSAAERFCVDPTKALPSHEADGLTVKCTVVPEEAAAGTLYRAEITVEREGKVIYRLSTARYVSEVS